WDPTSCSTSTTPWARAPALVAASASPPAPPERCRMPASVPRTGSNTMEQVESIWPYCGVGCQVTYNVKDNHIIQVDGRNGPANESRLCVKGRYGFDYPKHPHRLTKPLIRRDDAPAKSADLHLDPAQPLAAFREASWEEALVFAATGLTTIRDTHGSSALAGFGCAKGSKEEAYLVQKMIRAGFGTNSVDHCTRLCHAASVAALGQCVGAGAVSNPV